MFVLTCLAAAGVVTGAIYAVQKSTGATAIAGAATGRSEADRAPSAPKGPVGEPIRSPREEIPDHPDPEDQLSTAQANAIAQQARSTLGTLPLVRHGCLPLPGSFAADPEFNPEGRELTPELHATLADLIRATNEQLSDLEKSRVQQALSWARDRIVVGDFEFANDPGPSYPREYGSIAVSIADRDDLPKRVFIVPGECAAIDVIVEDVHTLITNAVDEIKSLFAK